MAFVIIPAVGLVVDGGYALAQRRAAQNASDFAALAGARIVAEKVGGDAANGTDANVKAAIVNAIAVNRGQLPVAFWTLTSKDTSNNPCSATPTGQPGCEFPYYVNSSGAFVGYVGVAAAIPSGSAGVRLNGSLKWTPFFVGGIVGNWTATATATAMGGYAAGGPGDNVFPIGIAQAFFTGRNPCSGDATTNVGGSGVCDPAHLTPGSLNVPGGFGWLKFGCDGYGLGQVAPANNGGCQNNKPFLQTEIGTGTTPTPSSYGCCTEVGLANSADLIGSLPGNKASADCSYYIDNKVVVTIPVWNSAGGTGSNAFYHIVGFTGFQITACHGGKDVEGVWRVPFFLGPTTSTAGFSGQALAAQLVQ